MRCGIIAGVLAGLACQAVMAQPGRANVKSKVSVDLISSVEGVVPGKPFDVGLRFQLADGWHIYWKNSGQSGMAPRVVWTLPDGFSAGPMQYPVPKRHVDAGSIVTNIIEGAPVLLTQMTPPGAIAGSEVTIGAKVRYLICQKTCIQGSDELELKLPVQAGGGDPKVANEKVFKRARKALPETSSKYLAIAGAMKPESLEPGQPFELTLNVAIRRGFHIQSNKPLSPSFIPTDVFLEPVDGVSFGEAVYPKAKIRKIKYLGDVAEFGGRIAIRIPGELDPEGDAGPRRIAGILRYQACNEKGTCFPPTAVTFAVGTAPGPKVGTAAPVAPADLQDAEVVPTKIAAVDEPSSDTVATPVEASIQEIPTEGGLEGYLASLGLGGMLLGCFLYGLSINLTPCVLPLLSIKVLGFVQQAHESRGRTFMLGLAFGLGVMILFVVLGFLAAEGTNILQFAAANIALGAIVLALALSMLGVYTLNVPMAATQLEANIQTEGVAASFFKGALAPVLGLACTGPFMAAMFGWATQQPSQIAFLGFLLTGAGMASPYVLLGANPNWLSFLPKPGPWMITFERIMGFLLLGMVVWLLHPVMSQMGTTGFEWTLVFLVTVGMACWVIGRIDVNMSSAVRWRYRATAAAIVVLPGLFIYGWLLQRPKVEFEWRTWSAAAVEREVESGTCAFVDFTAAYCTVCKANKIAAVNTPEFRDKQAALGFAMFQGDFSDGDEAIADVLREHSRAGVPLNLIYPPGRPDDPVVLRPQLTKGYLLDKLDEVCTAQVAGMPRSGA